MRFVHFSDTHLGFSDLNKIDPQNGINQRESDFYAAWWAAIEKILELKPDFAIHAGDLFQSPRPNNRAIRVAMEGIQKLGKAGIPFVVVAGNHSTPRNRQTGSIFESLELFPHVHAAYQSKYRRFRIGDCALHCIPHCSLSEELQEAYEAVTPDPEAQYQVFVTHGAWREGRDTIIGSVGEFNEQFIDNPEQRLGIRFDYIALGHYHKHLEITPNAVYSGSTERTSFNEIGYTSGIVLVDLRQRLRDYIEIPSRPMRKLGPIPCDRLTAEEIYAKLARLAGEIPEGCLLRLDLEQVSRATLLDLDMQQIDALFPQAFYIDKVIFPMLENDLIPASSSIGSLPVEFERYLNDQEDLEVDRDKLLQLGLALLAQVEHQESP